MKSEQEYLSYENIDRFSCTDLRTIDRLWKYYSDGHFGFSTQKEIYERIKGKIPKHPFTMKNNFLRNYLEEVGWLSDDTDISRGIVWRDQEKIIYYPLGNLPDSVPRGHLPYYYLQKNRKSYISRKSMMLVGSAPPMGDWNVFLFLLVFGWRNKIGRRQEWQRREVLAKLFSRIKTCKM